ncbi:MAG: SDR family oxidoreductase [Candidatus Velthaea sp.]
MSDTHKVALITGASSGIGAATARELASRGYHLALAARRRDALEVVASEVRTQGGGAIPIACDMTKPDQIATCVAHTMKEFGRIDVLVNSAGVMHIGMIDGGNVEEWRQMIDTNLVGLMLMTREVLPHMKAADSGHIINISSVAGKIIRTGSGVYNVTKWGVNVFTEALRQELVTENIRVTSIGPGAVNTELMDNIGDPEARAGFKAWIASIESLGPEDIARAVGYVVEQPNNVSVNDLVIRPTQQER